ncbi:hypothetical protein [Polaromonas sp. YR568]|uniref:hypothetical protein n=1 Tax=Polaromonas sp. YR568 TaxID=1855301 RepID=UPI00398BD546
MNQPDEMDLTLYLQTEGRRLAAELARQQQATGKPRSSSSPAQQQQCAAQPGNNRPARSLSETLQRMGVANAHPRRRV